MKASEALKGVDRIYKIEIMRSMVENVLNYEQKLRHSYKKDRASIWAEQDNIHEQLSGICSDLISDIEYDIDKTDI